MKFTAWDKMAMLAVVCLLVSMVAGCVEETPVPSTVPPNVNVLVMPPARPTRPYGYYDQPGGYVYYPASPPPVVVVNGGPRRPDCNGPDCRPNNPPRGHDSHDSHNSKPGPKPRH